MLVCCYALRSSILEIHLFGEVPGGAFWCFAMGINLVLLLTLTNETGYSSWVGVGCAGVLLGPLGGLMLYCVQRHPGLKIGLGTP
jgi:hypothetical protein